MNQMLITPKATSNFALSAFKYRVRVGKGSTSLIKPTITINIAQKARLLICRVKWIGNINSALIQLIFAVLSLNDR